MVTGHKNRTAETTVVHKPITLSYAVRCPQPWSRSARDTDKKGSEVIVQIKYKASHIEIKSKTNTKHFI